MVEAFQEETFVILQEVAAEIDAVLKKHNIKQGILIFPHENGDGDVCLRLHVGDKGAAQILKSVAKDLASGKYPQEQLRSN